MTTATIATSATCAHLDSGWYCCDVEINVRNAHIADAQVLADIHRHAWSNGFAEMFTSDQIERATRERCNAQRWQSFLTDGSHVLVAEEKGHVVGFVQFTTSDNGDGEVVRMYVSPTHWGTGVAQTLMHASLDYFRRHGASNVLLMAADTGRARRFYEKCGFSQTGATQETVVFEGLTSTDIWYSLRLSKE